MGNDAGCAGGRVGSRRERRRVVRNRDGNSDGQRGDVSHQLGTGLPREEVRATLGRTQPLGPQRGGSRPPRATWDLCPTDPPSPRPAVVSPTKSPCRMNGVWGTHVQCHPGDRCPPPRRPAVPGGWNQAGRAGGNSPRQFYTFLFPPRRVHPAWLSHPCPAPLTFPSRRCNTTRTATVTCRL